NWKLFLYLTVLMAMMNMVSHGTQDMYPTFLQRDWGFGPTTRSALTAFSQVGALTGGVLCGLYSDRLGRRRTIALALVGAILVIPIWAFAPSLPLLIVGAFVMPSRDCSRGPHLAARWATVYPEVSMSTFVKATQVYQQGQRTLPGRYYTSAEIYAEEQERIFTARWICAGRAAEIPEAGDYV